MNLKKNNLANGLALATAILWVLCSGFTAVFTDFSHTVTQWWMHGMDLAPFNLTFANFVWGGLTLIVSAWLAGYIFGLSMELVSKIVKK